MTVCLLLLLFFVFLFICLQDYTNTTDRNLMKNSDVSGSNFDPIKFGE